MLSILVVCTGNICRSPLAEALLADRASRLLPGRVRVRSAGTWAADGSMPTAESLAVARELGLDASAQRSARLTTALLEEADLVLGMAEEHRDEILSLLPAAEQKTFTLKELAGIVGALPPADAPDEEAVRLRIAEADTLRRPSFAGDVADPLGRGLDAYRDVGWDIETAIDEVLAGLFGVREEAAPGVR